jgi:hypothetical protein
MICSIVRTMHYLNNKNHSWLLMLIVAISIGQSAMAINVNQNSHGEEYQMALMPLSDSNGMEIGGSCRMQQGENQCIDTECSTPCDFPSLQTPHAALLATDVESEQKSLTGWDAIFSRHPDLLERPPKA